MDPRDAWDYTPGELLDAIDGYKARLETLGYFGYNLAQAVACFCFGSRRPSPWQVFPGMIEQEVMSDEAIFAALMGGMEEPECRQDG